MAMKHGRKALRLAGWSVLLAVLLDGSAQAYIDPGTGSYIFQLLIAGLLGAAFTAKVFWKRIGAFLTGFVRRSGSAEGHDTKTDN